MIMARQRVPPSAKHVEVKTEEEEFFALCQLAICYQTDR